MKNSITFRLNPKHAEDREIMEWLDANAAEEGGQTALVKSALLSVIHGNKVSNRRLSQVISADYLRQKHLSQSAVNEAKAHFTGCHRRLSRAYFSSAMAGLK